MRDLVPPSATPAQPHGDRDRASPMLLALAAAREAALVGEVPVGAVVTDSAGTVLAIAANRTERDCDATAHAEILALRAAAAARGSPRLPDCDLWVTLEPCPMCATAAGLFRIKRLMFGAYDPKGGGIEHGARIYATAGALHRPEVVGGLNEQEAGSLLQSFFALRR